MNIISFETIIVAFYILLKSMCFLKAKMAQKKWRWESFIFKPSGLWYRIWKL